MYMYIHHHLFSINYYDFIYKYFILHAAILYAHAWNGLLLFYYFRLHAAIYMPMLGMTVDLLLINMLHWSCAMALHMGSEAVWCVSPGLQTYTSWGLGLLKIGSLVGLPTLWLFYCLVVSLPPSLPPSLSLSLPLSLSLVHTYCIAQGHLLFTNVIAVDRKSVMYGTPIFTPRWRHWQA